MHASFPSGLAALDWTRGFLDALTTTHESYLDLPANRQSQGRPALTRHTKIESTVRYLRIELDDALAIAEQVDV
jgi:hypothetical protein